eukprot:CAMPEP_0185904182 /NCGR_PEP_ID=MMETSP0196C-20130402/3498_1 /TAXON_ID=2932 /ORGANISM="Alexandrium fundyense, Strain CCMP1719" /LENGTH=39 /DNA_ID= /DNA_START= /DNA_END= /DNA_ORIENTATION=
MKEPAEIAIFGEMFYQAGYVPIDRRDVEANRGDGGDHFS